MKKCVSESHVIVHGREDTYSKMRIKLNNHKEVCSLETIVLEQLEKSSKGKFSTLAKSIDRKTIKYSVEKIKFHFNRMKHEWFPNSKYTLYSVSVFWTAFMTYIFPWLLDIAKVYCAFMVIQGFYKEHAGQTGRDGRTGFQSLIYYGKWYIAFWLIPTAVELIDQIGQKMHEELQRDGFKGFE